MQISTFFAYSSRMALRPPMSGGGTSTTLSKRPKGVMTIELPQRGIDTAGGDNGSTTEGNEKRRREWEEARE